MARRHAVRLLMFVLLLALAPATAQGAVVTLQPSPAEARTFATTNGGWSSAVDYNGLVCIPGVTCPSANPTYQTTGGAGGAGDGFLRASHGTLLGVLSTTTIAWTSPSFVAPAVVDTATLSFDVRPQIASLRAIGTVNVRFVLIDVGDGTKTATIADVPLTAASSSFSTLQATIPTDKFVPGRTYRVRLESVLTTQVSAVTSGNVDFDNVVLRSAQLDKPTGLTADFPSSGPVRIAGSVDPAGQPTTVTVDYGTTASYGSTAGPVSVPGAAGAQSFDVPLSGLTPGTTYHYSVTATNADGSVSSSDDVFVAPAAPSTSAAPVVTGSATERGRIVTFTRPLDVASASVEVLDGADAVVATFPDGDGDGEVALDLPDLDGQYGLRVVRKTDRDVASTSTTVSTVLDRAGPSAAGLGLTVLPSISSDRARTVSFTRPADAETVTAQVVDSADDSPVGAPVTVAGGSATVELGSTDGAYAVELLMTDPYGNTTSVQSELLVLDTVAPDAGPAPTVTGADNVRSRDVSFTRALDAATVVVEVVDADDDVVGSVPVGSGASATVVLPNLDGAYRLRVVQTDAAGNDATSPAAAVVLDRVAPDVGDLALTVAPELSSSRQRTVSFTRPADAETVTAQVIDDDDADVGEPVTATGGSATVELGVADGAYRVRLTLADGHGNSASATSDPVTLDTSAPDPGSAPIVTGAVNSRARGVSFARAVDAAEVDVELLDDDDQIVDTVAVPVGDTASLTLPDADGAYGVRVTQRDLAGNEASSPTRPIRLDRSGPDVSGVGLSVTPAVSTAGQRTVSFTRPADAETVVAQVIDAGDADVGAPVTVAGGSATVQLGAADGAYRVRLTFTDADENSSTVLSDPVTLDTAAPDAGPAPTVTGPVNSRSRQVSFTRASDAAAVDVELLDGDDQTLDTISVASGSTASLTLPNADGTYGVRVTQRDLAGNEASSPTRSIRLDRTGPDVSGVGLSVTPALSSSHERAVAFTRPAGVVTVVAQVIDGSDSDVGAPVTVAGESGTVQLGAADGAYRVRLTFTDADENSATVLSDPVTLDATPPDAGPAPTVTGANDSRSRAVAFTRDPDAETVAVELLDGGGAVIATIPVAGGAGATLELPDRDGSYAVRVAQADALGNRATSPATAIVLARTPVDTPKPPIDTPTPPAPIACTSGSALLTEVTLRGSTVKLGGWSARRAGTKVTLRDTTGRIVATATVGADGRFSATAAAPSPTRRRTTAYVAVVGRDRAPSVPLQRPNALTGVTVDGTTVTLRGRLDLRRLGTVKQLDASGGVGACPRGNAALRSLGKAQVARDGSYVLRVRVAAGSRHVVVRTRAVGTKWVSRSTFAVR